jgi:hypothetical protein
MVSPSSKHSSGPKRLLEMNKRREDERFVFMAIFALSVVDVQTVVINLG